MCVNKSESGLSWLNYFSSRFEFSDKCAEDTW